MCQSEDQNCSRERKLENRTLERKVRIDIFYTFRKVMERWVDGGVLIENTGVETLLGQVYVGICLC